MKDFCSRNARQEKYYCISMLSRAIRRCDVHHPDQKAYSLLFLQSHSSLCSNFIDGAIGVHSSTGFWRKANTRYMLVCRTVCLQIPCVVWVPLDNTGHAKSLALRSVIITRHAATHTTPSHPPHDTDTHYQRAVLALPWRTQTRSKFKMFISGVTILLSLTVFLNLVAEKIPTTSDAVPLIGMLGLLGASCVWRPVSLADCPLILGGHRHQWSPESHLPSLGSIWHKSLVV